MHMDQEVEVVESGVHTFPWRRLWWCWGGLPNWRPGCSAKGERESATEAKIGGANRRGWWREVPGTFRRRRGRWIWPLPSPWPPVRARTSCSRKCFGGEGAPPVVNGWCGSAGSTKARHGGTRELQSPGLGVRTALWVFLVGQWFSSEPLGFAKAALAWCAVTVRFSTPQKRTKIISVVWVIFFPNYPTYKVQLHYFRWNKSMLAQPSDLVHVTVTSDM